MNSEVIELNDSLSDDDDTGRDSIIELNEPGVGEDAIYNQQLSGNAQRPDYSEVPVLKPIPGDSYCRMIINAIISTPGRSISLEKLFEYISQNYPYFSQKPVGWQTPIENYLCRSSHFVKALPKDFVEGYTEMWILNPVTESKVIADFNRELTQKIQVNKRSLGAHRNEIEHSNISNINLLIKMIARFNRGSSEKIQVNKRSLGAHRIEISLNSINSNSSNINPLNNENHCSSLIHKDKIVKQSQNHMNNPKRTKLSQPLRRTNNKTSINTSRPSTVLEKWLTSKSTKASNFQKGNVHMQNKTADDSHDGRQTRSYSGLIQNLRKHSSNNTKQTDNPKIIANTPDHIEIYEISSGDENERPAFLPPKSTGIKLSSGNPTQFNTVSAKGINKSLLKVLPMTLRSQITNKTNGVKNMCPDGQVGNDSVSLSHADIATCSGSPTLPGTTNQNTCDIVILSTPLTNPIRSLSQLKSTNHDNAPNCVDAACPDISSVSLGPLISSSCKPDSHDSLSRSRNSPNNNHYTPQNVQVRKESANLTRTKERQYATEEIVDVPPVIRHTDSIFCQCFACKKNKYVSKKKPLKPFQCNLCDKSYSWQSGLSIHLNNHSRRKKFVCELCCTGFTENRSLKMHKQSVHFTSTLEPLKCSTCDKLCKTSGSLRSHIKSVHRKHSKEALTPVACDICQKVFPNKHKMKKHVLRSHVNRDTFICNECHATYRTRQQMINHVMTHMPPTVSCSKCSQLLHTKQELKKHMQNKHFIVSRKTYICDVCGKINSCTTSLKKHMRIHTEEKPYVCEECGKSFRTDSNLSQHSLSHSDLRPFSCGHCEKSFRIRHHLSQHMAVHGLSTVPKYGKRGRSSQMSAV